VLFRPVKVKMRSAKRSVPTALVEIFGYRIWLPHGKPESITSLVPAEGFDLLKQAASNALAAKALMNV
jgi:hypothetical protein